MRETKKDGLQPNCAGRPKPCLQCGPQEPPKEKLFKKRCSQLDNQGENNKPHLMAFLLSDNLFVSTGKFSPGKYNDY